MVHWYFDEVTVVEQMRKVQWQADRAQALGLTHEEDRTGWQRVRASLGQKLVGLGKRLQRVEPVRRPDLASSSQCGLR